MESFGQEAARLKPAFDAVADPTDWRAPIRCSLTRISVEALGGLETIREAIRFYTATEATIALHTSELGASDFYVISATGYREGPAGP